MKCRVIGNDIVSYGIELNNTIENKINPCINNMATLLNDITWQGKSKDSFTSSYNNTVFEIKKIAKVLKIFNMFLNQTMDDYSELMQELKKTYDELENDIDTINVGDIYEQ